MKVAVAFDHRGVALRAAVIGGLVTRGHDVLDVGVDRPAPSVDYPDKAREVAEAILDGRAERGILACSSGLAFAIAANKIAGIRAGVGHDPTTTRLGVEEAAMNLLCLGADLVGPGLVADILYAFVETDFAGEGRELAQLGKLAALERGASLTEGTRL